MKRLSISVVLLALACMAMAGVASGATVNDRFYTASISPATVAPTSLTRFDLKVTNDLQSAGAPDHFIRQIIVTVPSGFVLHSPPSAPAGTSPVEPPTGWKVQSTVGQVITLVTISATDVSMDASKVVDIYISATAPTPTGTGCNATKDYIWSLDVNQDINGGKGNTYPLRKGSPVPTVTVASSECVTPTILTLDLTTSNFNQTIRTTDVNASVTLKATLTSSLVNSLGGHDAIPGELIIFTMATNPITTCGFGSNQTTDGNGIATCIYYPQASPNTPLVATTGLGDAAQAIFGGDSAPNPGWGGAPSNTEYLVVSADGTSVTVDNVTSPYGGTATLTAKLTAFGGVAVGNKLIAFFLCNDSITEVGHATTDPSSGVATLQNASVAGYNVGDHDGCIVAKFGGDPTYGAREGSGTLTITSVSANISLSKLTQVYNGSQLSPTVTTVPANLSVSWSGAPQTNAGTYLNVTATLNDGNHTGSASGTFVITPATVTAVITASPKVYDTALGATILTCDLIGLAAVDVGHVTCTASGVFASPNVANGIVVTATSVIPSSTNYQVLVMPQTTANITPAASSVNVTGGTFVYNGSARAATGLASTSVGSLTNPTAVVITYSGSCSSSGAPTTVAEGTSCTATGTYAGDANHSGSSNTASVTITLAASSVTVTGGTFVYDTTAHAATGLASTTAGSLTNPTDVVITYGGSCAVAPTTVSQGTTCTATGTYAGDANHAGSSNTASVTITPATPAIKFTQFMVNAASGSTGTMTYSTTTPGACTVDSTTGLVTILGPPGNCNVVASQAADPNYITTSRSTFTIQQ